MDENEEYFQRQASHRQSRRRFRKINQKGERQTIIDTVDPYPAGKPPIARGYHTVSCSVSYSFAFTPPPLRWVAEVAQCCSVAVVCFCVMLLLQNLLCSLKFVCPVYPALCWVVLASRLLCFGVLCPGEGRPRPRMVNFKPVFLIFAVSFPPCSGLFLWFCFVVFPFRARLML